MPGMTVAENVFLGREPRRVGLLDRRRMIDDTAVLLERLGSSISPRAPVETLSVASFQIVEIAKALSIEADVVAMDEPSAVLSGSELEQLFDVVAALKTSGRRRARTSATDSTRCSGSATATRSSRTVRCRAPVSSPTSSRDDLVKMMVGREVSQVFPRRFGSARISPASRCTIFTWRGLAAPVSFDGQGAARSSGIVGLNGAGRTTLAKGLFGAVPARGEVAIDGVRRERVLADPPTRCEAGLAMLPEDRQVEGLALHKSVRWNASLNILESFRHGGLIDERRREDVRIRGGRASSGSAPDTTRARSPGSLSGGNQQKVVLAKWLASETEGAGPRRADPRHRRRIEGADLRADPRTGRRTAWRSW